MLRHDLAVAYRQMLDLALPYTRHYFGDVDEWDLHALLTLQPTTFYWVVCGSFGSYLDAGADREIIKYNLARPYAIDGTPQQFFIFAQGVLRAVTLESCARHVAETKPPLCQQPDGALPRSLPPRSFNRACQTAQHIMPAPWNKRAPFLYHYMAQHPTASRFYLILQNAEQHNLEEVRIAGNDHEYSLHAAIQYADGHPSWTRYFTLETTGVTPRTQPEMLTLINADIAQRRLQKAELELKLAHAAIRRTVPRRPPQLLQGARAA